MENKQRSWEYYPVTWGITWATKKKPARHCDWKHSDEREKKKKKYRVIGTLGIFLEIAYIYLSYILIF